MPNRLGIDGNQPRAQVFQPRLVKISVGRASFHTFCFRWRFRGGKKCAFNAFSRDVFSRKSASTKGERKMSKTSLDQKRIASLFHKFLKGGVGTYSAIQKYYGNLPSIDDAVENACSFLNAAETLEPHQYRIRKTAKAEYFDNVQKVKTAISNCRDFKSLYDLLTTCKPKYVGDLAVYDAALRIGAFLRKKKPNCNFEPQEVYLHRGTEVGAKKLEALGVLAPSKAKIRPVSDFSWLDPQFANDSKFAALVEIFLCVEKGSF